MNTPYVELKPFTQCEPPGLGRGLSDLVQQNIETIPRDFKPDLLSFYRPVEAEATVMSHQVLMRQRRGFGVFAVYMGVDANDAYCGGLATYNRQRVMGNSAVDGPRFFVWLAANRPQPLRRIGREVVTQLMRRALDDSAIKGRMWALVQEENIAAATLLEADYSAYGWDGFRRKDKSIPYPYMTGTDTPCQLYVARKNVITLRSLRTKSS